ncbi:hypothetical protein DNTS_021627 [Danionella cerebrum]|uniref:C2H2-type domain-containing protein n=1 Tax=Danionella cerebrum TaxID=2873325 RepID=A0A553QY68_9TELE|nr:hypothetical protein DNTS_021627 [Danionella translucida]
MIEQAASAPTLHLEHLSASPSETAFAMGTPSHVQGTETSGHDKVELKLAPLIIEPITPEEETVQPFELPLPTQRVDFQPEDPKEAREEGVSAEDVHCESQESEAELRSDLVTGVECDAASIEDDSKNVSCASEDPVCSSETPEVSNDTKSSEKKVYTTERKNIPPKKDKFNPLRLDMTKVIPLTSSDISLQCQECHIIFCDSKSKARHLKLSHPEDYNRMMGNVVFFCYVCDQTFRSSAELMAHQRTHTNGDRFKCPFCNEAFNRSSELTSHKKKNHYGKQSNTCKECGKVCKTITLLRYHLQVHSAGKLHVCSHKHCGKRFRAAKSFHNHLRKHLKLDATADQTNTSPTVKKVKAKETDTRTFPCSQCNVVFKTSTERVLHVRNKHCQESVSHLKSPGLTQTQIVNGQAQTVLKPIAQTLVPNKLDAEHIKELIEKLGNVQKVNQLVILPLQPQSFGLPFPQPLHINFNQTSTCMKSDANPSDAGQTSHTTVAGMGEPMEKGVSSDNTETQNSNLDDPQTQVQPQIRENLFELVPVQTEPHVLLHQTPLQRKESQDTCVPEEPQSEEFVTAPNCNEILETADKPPLKPQSESEHLEGFATLENTDEPLLNPLLELEKSQQLEGIAALETSDEPPSNPQSESEKSQQVQRFSTLKTTEEPPLNPQLETSQHLEELADLETTKETFPISNCELPDTATEGKETSTKESGREPDNVDELTEPQKLLKLEQEQTMLGPKCQSFNSVPDKESTILQQLSPATQNQTNAEEQKSSKLVKKASKKKKKSKKDSKEASNVGGDKGESSKKVKKSSKGSSQKKKKEEKLNDNLGSNEKKRSKQKPKKKQNQQSSDQHQGSPASQGPQHLEPNQKLQKVNKGKAVAAPSEAAVKLMSQVICGGNNVLMALEPVPTSKSKKRKNNQNSSPKKTKCVLEAREDVTKAPLPKKKKQTHPSENNIPKKKPKVKKSPSGDFKKKTNKLPKLNGTTSGDPNQAHIEKQALLLLKGLKQPQLKVHKLDATELEKSPPEKNTKGQKTKNSQKKSNNVAKKTKRKSDEKKLMEFQGEPLTFEMSLVESPQGCVPTKAKVSRKRKAPTKIDQEIALSPPYSQLTLGCQDCGKTFSEVSALQQHLASWHSAGELAISDDFDIAKKHATEPSPTEKHILPNVFEINIATDWDLETEVGEIVAERLSFPALCQSPSLLQGSSGPEGKERGDDVEKRKKQSEKNPFEGSVAPSESSTPALVGSVANENSCQTETGKEDGIEVITISEPSRPDLKGAVEEEMKDELPLGVTLVMVGDQNVEDHNTFCLPQDGVSNTSLQKESAEDVICETVLKEIKQEEEEILVPRADDQKRAMGEHSVKKGKKGKSGGTKRGGRRSSAKHKHKKDMVGNKDMDDPVHKKKETLKNGSNASESGGLLSQEDIPEEQVVFELDSVTTSVVDIMNSEEGSSETSRGLGREGNSPGIILEKYLTNRERNTEAPISQFPLRQTSEKRRDVSGADVHRLPLQKQCIFYPVKEEEKELRVEYPRAAPTSCENIRGDEGFLEFISESSDTDEADVLHAEPEAETVVLSCYHEIQRNGSANQNGAERNDSAASIVAVSPAVWKQPEGGNRKPINYFNQYFSTDTWNEIAVSTRTPNLTKPVTEREVAQYVGIHIAMGTLKFPSTALYWENDTRVPLISDAMLASRFSELARKLKLVGSGPSSMDVSSDQQSAESSSGQPGQRRGHDSSNPNPNPLWKVASLINRVQAGCRALERNGSFAVDQYPLAFQRHPTQSLLHTVVVSSGGLVLDFNLSIDVSSREHLVEKMVSRGEEKNIGVVFLCKPELSTPSMVEHLLEAGVQSAGKVGGSRGQIGDEFVSSDGKLKLFRCHHGFILAAVVKEKPRSTSLVSGFERAIKAANLNRDLRSLYRTPSTNSAVGAWPQSVLWDLIDLALVNAWIEYKQNYCDKTDPLSLMAFRLEVAKALIHSSGVEEQDSSPTCPPAPKLQSVNLNTRPTQAVEAPLPDDETRYDGADHWPEQVTEGEEAQRCQFGGCEKTSRVRCLKCCVFLCISRNHNCFLKFHSQGFS